MTPFLVGEYANPSSSHKFAREVRRAVDEARDKVAVAIGCKPGEIIFTGGGTEGDNAAILGAVRKHGGTALSSAAEHHAVLHCVEHVGGIVLPVDANGAINIDALSDTLHARTDVTVASVMAVNNEVGTITDMARVSKVVRTHSPKTILHTDAVQAACWLDLTQLWPLVDVLTLSAHKFGGPKGMGIMVLREGIQLEPLILGGGQERDRRSGTHNVAGIVGTAEALALTHQHRAEDLVRLAALRAGLYQGLAQAPTSAMPTVPQEVSVPGVAHVCVPGIESESLLYLLDQRQVCASAASACASGALEPSHVLAAMGIDRARATGALRLSLGHATTTEDIAAAVPAIHESVAQLRNIATRR
jgi:cysteine desulfurase